MKFPIGNKQQTTYKQQKNHENNSNFIFFHFQTKISKKWNLSKTDIGKLVQSVKIYKRRTEIFVPLISTLERFHREFPTQLRIFLHYLYLFTHSYTREEEKESSLTLAHLHVLCARVKMCGGLQTRFYNEIILLSTACTIRGGEANKMGLNYKLTTQRKKGENN